MGNLSAVDYEHYDLDKYGAAWEDGVPVFTFFYPDDRRIRTIKKAIAGGWSLDRACGLVECEVWRVREMLKG